MLKGICTRLACLFGVVVLLASSIAYVAPSLVNQAIRRIYVEAKNDNLPAAILDAFKANALAFSARATVDEISRIDVLKTFRDVEHLLVTPSALIDRTHRLRVGLEIVAYSAHPAMISQGAHGTCSVTTIEILTFTRAPHLASDLIVSAALHEKWFAPNGQLVVVPSATVKPGPEESTFPPLPLERSQASEIFQVTMLDAVGQVPHPRVLNALTNEPAPGPLIFVQLPQHLQDGDTGEFWVNADGHLINVFSGLDAVGILRALGVLYKNKGEVLIGNVEQHLPSVASEVGSSADLARTLQRLSDNKSLPAILMVRGHDAVFGGPVSALFEKVDHVVVISKFDAAHSRAYVENPWGRPLDRWLSVDDLYDATKISWPAK